MSKINLFRGILFFLGILITGILSMRLVASGEDSEKKAKIRFLIIGMIAGITSLEIMMYVYKILN